MKKIFILLAAVFPILAIENKMKKTHKNLELYERKIKIQELSFLKSMEKKFRNSMPYDDSKELDAYLLLQTIQIFEKHKNNFSLEEKTLLSSYSSKSKMSDFWKKRKIEPEQMINLEKKQEKKEPQTGQNH